MFDAIPIGMRSLRANICWRGGRATSISRTATAQRIARSRDYRLVQTASTAHASFVRHSIGAVNTSW